MGRNIAHGTGIPGPKVGRKTLGMQLACNGPKINEAWGGGMSMFKDPFDPKALLANRCSCGGAHAEGNHSRLTATAVPAGEGARWDRGVDAAGLRAGFPAEAQRPLFLKTVGAATAMAAISPVLPLRAARQT